MKPLPSLRSDLLRHKLDGELLVYDPKDEQVHLLNGSTAKVVELMDGGVSADRIASELGRGGSSESGAEMLALALDELALARLIETPAKTLVAPALEGTTRREMVQRAAAAGAMLLIPTILTLTPNAAGAQSTGRALKATCNASTQCASGCCGTNSSGTCDNGLCSPAGCGNGSGCASP